MDLQNLPLSRCEQMLLSLMNGSLLELVKGSQERTEQQSESGLCNGIWVWLKWITVSSDLEGFKREEIS